MINAKARCEPKQSFVPWLRFAWDKEGIEGDAGNGQSKGNRLKNPIALRTLALMG